ncbi:hypothetical protein S40293_07456 [Stachybotrys chartarum IBT 40293]|nr:hypothetical protein S40293_07456 [Stachybotrys chartarum IBT 40293]
MTLLRFTTPLVRSAAIRPSSTRLAVHSRHYATQEELWRHREAGARKPGQEAEQNVSEVRPDADALAAGSAKGSTGGGEPLQSTSPNAPSPPKISNFAIKGADKKLSEEQQREVDEHNKDFDQKHDRGNQAPDDKVDKKFWSR